MNYNLYEYVYSVCGSLVVTLTVIRLPGPRFKPRSGKIFGRRILLHAQHETSPQEPKMVPSPDTKRGLVVGCRYHHRKKNKTTEIDCYAIDTSDLEPKDR